MLGSIAQIIRSLVGHDPLYFDTPLPVKATLTAETINFWAAYVSPKGEVFVMDNEEEWYLVEQNEKSAQVMESLFQRVRFMKQQLQAKKGEAAL